MLVTLDLTVRQASRMLAEAVKSRAKLEIDPRPEFRETPLWGTLEGRNQDLLQVNLVDTVHPQTVAELLGVMCDVRTILSGQLYLFSTVILEATDNSAPRRLGLALPDAIQVANRRRYARRSPIEPVPVRLLQGAGTQPLVGTMTNISRSGLGCRLPRQQAEDQLLIGDEVQLEFALPWLNQVYTLPSEVCTKSSSLDPDHLTVGFEFVARDAACRATLELVRAAIDNETRRLTEEEEGTL